MPNPNNRNKTKNTTTGKQSQGKQKKNSRLPLIIVTAVILCGAIAAIAVPKITKSSNTAANSNTAAATTGSSAASSGSSDVQVIQEGGRLIIPVSEVTTTAKFYKAEVDGTQMEIIAVKDSDGYIRTAFNTCQICYSSGRGYYVQSGDALVCQNCGNRFTINQIEVESGGCNPWPIFPENKTVSDTSVEISYDFLKESKDIFANWKVF